MDIPSIPGRLLEQAGRRPDMPAYFEKRDGDWIPTSYEAYAAAVRRVARGLVALGVDPGERLCILGGNRSEWVLSHVAGMLVGAVPAGIYATCSAEEVGWILAHAEARVVVVEDAAQLAKVLPALADLEALVAVVLMEGEPPSEHPAVIAWSELLERGRGVEDEVVDSRLAALEPDAPATFIYTSGTTGPPKAVMLSHRNLTWTADQAVALTGLAPGDSNLSYLPLSHIAEQVFTIHAPITGASAVFFVESRDRLPENLREVQPTVLFGVPRVWEKLHAAVEARLAEAEGTRRRVLDWAMGVARQVHARRNRGEDEGAWLRLQHRLADRLVFQKLKPLLGLGAARLCVSGAAPIRPEILEFFSGLDVVIHEVYGQSEDTGPTSFNLPGRTRFGSVGPAFPGVELSLAEDGEILVRGPNVFLGYFKDPEATSRTLDEEGWLHSGDLGQLDEDGFLHITGRKKDIIITAGGKNIAPRPLEEGLGALPLVSQAVVLGDRQRFLVALLALDPDQAARFAEEHGLDPDQLPLSDELAAALQPGIDALNARVAKVEGIKRWAVLPRELSLEEGELTPTLKIKRRTVTENWGALIASLYEDAPVDEAFAAGLREAAQVRPQA